MSMLTLVCVWIMIHQEENTSRKMALGFLTVAPSPIRHIGVERSQRQCLTPEQASVEVQAQGR
jgi:CO/xanthine dehydrogenase FAD-binding subunit